MENTDSPWIKYIHLDLPSLQDNTADADRLTAALRKELQADHVDIDLGLLKNLSELLRRSEFKIHCIVFRDHGRWTLCGIHSPTDTHTVAGLAVDLGTTRVVLRLMDLNGGDTLAESAFDNPQINVGPDILARIHYADTKGGLDRLNQLIVSGLNHAIENMCAAQGIRPGDIYAVSVAGNTTMSHLFMGLNPHWIIREPYIPAVNRPGILKAIDLGLNVSPQARTIVFPNIGSYFGGDLIAGILFCGLNRQSDTAILVDVGTNAEVVLGNQHWLIACAGAAGPALEGGVTRMGMMAGPGAIDRIAINPSTHEIRIHTIEDSPPIGICGSGVIDLAAQLYLSGMVDLRGKLVPAACGGRLKKMDGLLHLVVVPAPESATGEDLTISQADLDSLVRSKAAMYTILETISGSVGIDLADLKKFYVAGTFGSFINPQSAISIGMLPDLPLQRYQALGNSSLGGAALALTSHQSLEEIDAIRDQITYMELNVNQDFMNRFSAARFLPHTDRSRFPTVNVWRNK